MTETPQRPAADPRAGRHLGWFEQGDGLSAAEALLIEKIQIGAAALVNEGARPEDDDARPEITIRAGLIRYLLLGGCPRCRPHEKGVRLMGARIEGLLDVEGCALETPLVLVNSFVASSMVLLYAEMGLLNLTGAKIRAMQGYPALLGDGLIGRAGVFLSGAEAIGEVRLAQADIRGSLVAIGAALQAGESGVALNVEGATIGGAVFLDGLRAAGRVGLARAAVSGDVAAEGAQLQVAEGAAFNADGLVAGGGVRLNEAACAGEARLLGARIGGNLECRGARFDNPGDDALSLDGATIGGSVMLREGFAATGETRLPNAQIDQSLECSDGRFDNPGHAALTADRARIGGSALFGGGAWATGEVRLVGAEIAGSFEAVGGRFDGAGLPALSLEQARIGGALFLRGGARSEADAAPMFSGALELSGARAGTLLDDPAEWPAAGDLRLDGFVYDRIDGAAAPKDAARRRDWLMRQHPDHLGRDFRTQPWEQLAKVLRDAGKSLEARRLGVARERARLRGGQISWWAQPVHRLYGVIAGYGYFTFRALLFAVGFWAFGALLFAGAWSEGAFTPRGSAVFEDPTWRACADDPALRNPAACWTAPGRPGADFEAFDPWLYSFDVLIPFVSIELETSWSPSPGRGAPLSALGPGGETADAPAEPAPGVWTIGDVAWGYRIFHELIGFLLAGFAAAGAARLAREE